MSAQARLESLDVLRGVAIFLVVAFHTSLLLNWSAPVTAGFAVGNLGVQLFFLISAFTMCYMWEARAGESRPVAKFYLRRWLRIAPPFWFAMILYTVIRWATRAPELASMGLGDYLLTVTFLHSFSPHAINLVVPGGWSIAVEMAFYVVFPFAVRALKTPLSRLVAGFVLFGAGMVGAQLLGPVLPENKDIFLYYSLLTQLPVFFVGMAVYQIVRGQSWPRWPWALGLLAVWVAVAFVAKNHDWLGRPIFWLEVFGLAVVVGLTLRWGLRWRPLQWLGRWSYSVYLFHFAVVDLVRNAVPWGQSLPAPLWYLGLLVTVLAVSSAVAGLSAVTLERGSAVLTKILLRRMKG